MLLSSSSSSSLFKAPFPAPLAIPSMGSSSKWKKLKSLLGFRICAVPAPPLPQAGRFSDDTFVSTPSFGLSTPSITASHSAPSTPRRSHRPISHSSTFRPSRSTCAICLESMKPGYGHALFTAECSHTFHFSCIASSVRYGNLVCPVCRAKWKEVPWEAPTQPHKSEKTTRRSSSGPLRVSGHRNTSDMRLIRDPVLSILDGNIANARRQWQNSSSEPRVFDDDEPLVCESNTPNKRSQEDFKGEMVKITVHPEVSAIKATDTVENFTVLIHLTAPCIHPMSCRTEKQTDSFQLAGGIHRAPIDLVTVLDISGSMSGTKLALLKRAMGFIIRNLSSVDRISIVVFSSSARRILPLRAMAVEGRQQALRAIEGLTAMGGTNIAEGLRKGAKVLEERRVRNPLSSIMLLSDGQDTYSMGTRRTLLFSPTNGVAPYIHLVPGSIRSNSRDGNTRIPVYTFGFGADHDATTMHSIAEISGGTFSFIQAEAAVQDAFAQCLGGLLSVVLQDVQMMISCGKEDLQIQAIRAGSYESSILENANHGLIKLGDLYAEEERDVLVELRLPSISHPTVEQAGSMTILHVGCIYKDPVTQELVDTPACEVSISRPLMLGTENQQGARSLEVDKQRNRLLAAGAITEARILAERNEISSAQLTLQNARNRIERSPSAIAGDELCSVLEAELAEIQGRIANRQTYERCGRAYLLSAESSHLRQRATMRGESVEGYSRDYQTSFMADMIVKSQTLSSPSTTHSSRRQQNNLPSMGLVSRATHSLLKRSSRKVT